MSRKQGQNPYRFCEDERCLTGTKCRAASWTGEYPVCTALTDPHFHNGRCPFYKTYKQFDEEYKRSNRI